MNMLQSTAEVENIRYHLGQFLANNNVTNNLDSLAEQALQERLAPMFLYTLNERQLQLKDSTLANTLLGETRYWSMFYLLQEQSMREINDVLTHAGIRCIWFKGSSLSQTIYPQPYLRVKSDLDFLVPEDDLYKALDILVQHQYERIPEDEHQLIPIVYERLSHHIALRHSQKQRIIAELHRHLLGLSGPRLIPPHHLNKWIDEAIEFEINGQTALTFKPEYHLLYLCAHMFMQHGEEVIGLRHLLDVHLMIQHYDIDWTLVVEESQLLRWTYLVDYTLQRVKAHFDTPIDDSISHMLKSYRPENETINQEFLAERRFEEGESFLHYIKELDFNDQFTAIRQIAFPPQTYMRERYDIPDNMPVFPYYLYRSGYQLKEILQAFLGIKSSRKTRTS